MAKISIVPWIAKKLKHCIGIVEDTDTASQAIASDKYVIWKGDVCKSTDDISEGDTLSSDNLSPVTDGIGNDLLEDVAANLLAVEEYTGTTPATGGLSITIGSFDNVVEWVVYIERSSIWYNETSTTYFANGQIVFYFGETAAQNREKAYRIKVIKKHG